jgi:hypothetical protein
VVWLFNLLNVKITPVQARVAQLDRASACGAEGRRFKSCHAYHVTTNIDPARNLANQVSQI